VPPDDRRFELDGRGAPERHLVGRLTDQGPLGPPRPPRPGADTAEPEARRGDDPVASSKTSWSACHTAEVSGTKT
jgi:hypothetical protein